MSQFAESFGTYRNRYENIRLEREDGVLTLTLHTKSQSLVWSQQAQVELGHCFARVAADRQNKVVIITGFGKDFCADADAASFTVATAREWDVTCYDSRRLIENLLDIEVPVIAAANGPARVHPELLVLSDIVLASESALFQDLPHFQYGFVPGDGSQIVWPLVLGENRGRYFLLTGQELDAKTALEYGAVNEVLPPDRLMNRANELAKTIAAKPELARRYTRIALTHRIKRLIHESVGYGHALEALAALE